MSGVTGTQSLTVTAPEPTECTAPTTVTLSAGASQTFEASECLTLPAGAAGDRYRVAVIRPASSGSSSDVVTATVTVTALTAQAAVSAARPAASSPLAGVKIDGAPFVARMERKARTRQAHFDMLEEIDLNVTRSCSGSTSPQVLVGFNDDLAIYQDSTERVTTAISAAAAQLMLDYYTASSKSMIEQYFGTPSDIDGNGRIVVTTAPDLADSVVALVWSGDLNSVSSCAASNQMELVYFGVDGFTDMDSGTDPDFVALGTIAHEVKHIVSVFNTITAVRASNPLWVEEGSAEIAYEMSSRIAWAAAGGPAVGIAITGDQIVNAVVANGGIQSKEMWGVVDVIANLIPQLSTHPNSMVTAPVGANEFHSIYAAGWHFHRFLGDAYGGASTALADGPFFKSLTDLNAAGGITAITDATGKTFDQLFAEMITAMSLHEVGTAPARAFTTYDLVTASDIFSGPAVLAPPGVYPWPVTTDSGGTATVGFTTATYSGSMGIAGIRIHDFLSTGGSDIQIEVSVGAPGSIVVTRIN